MAKLNASTAGWNAGKTYYAKPFKIEDIVIDPAISGIFTKKEKIVQEIARSMEEKGYDKSQPVVVTKDGHILIDGHTRVAAAKLAGLDEIPVVEAEFDDIEQAILYCFERQVLRRNLTDSEILQAVVMIKDRKARDGQGRAAEQLAERLGVSAGFLYAAKKVMRDAPPEDIQAIREGEKSISSVYRDIAGREKPRPERDKPRPERDKPRPGGKAQPAKRSPAMWGVTAADIAKERFHNYLVETLYSDGVAEYDETVWEFYTWLLEQAKHHKPDYSGLRSIAYQADAAEAASRRESGGDHVQ
jgi:ParB family chromosome partitioning protein